MALPLTQPLLQGPWSMRLTALLKAMVKEGASDLHLVAGSPPSARIRGQLVAMKGPPLTAEEVRELCSPLLTEARLSRLESFRQVDFSFGLQGLSRFRACLFFQRGTLSAAFRTLSDRIPTLAELGLPGQVEAWTRKPQGLLLVTGPAGSGKSTTLAAMVGQINRERRGHVVTIEDPIEYVHAHGGCLVVQREIFTDAHSFPEALRQALREDPDIILVGEMRDLETIQATLTAAETGHLTLATLHTNSAVQTLHRIIDAFPAEQQSQVRAQLSLVLEGVISQRLLPRADGGGRVLAYEVLQTTPAIRNLIREDKVHTMYAMMQVGQEATGMCTLNQSLASLCRAGLIRREDALARSSLPEELAKSLGPA